MQVRQMVAVVNSSNASAQAAWRADGATLGLAAPMALPGRHPGATAFGQTWPGDGAARPRPRTAMDALRRLGRCLAPWSFLRVDVDRPLDCLDRDLSNLHGRLSDGSLQAQPLPWPGVPQGLRLWHREADGEHYVYVEDLSAGCLAGCTVFNRLVELGRAADPHVRSPHSRYRTAYQRRGIATAVYAWALDQGIGLVSGARQSRSAHALWHKLGHRYGLAFVQLSDRRLRWLGTHVDAATADRLDARLMLWRGAPQRLHWLHGLPPA